MSDQLSPTTAKRLDKRVNTELQHRGKKVERWRRLKPLLILLALVFIGGPLVLLLTPALPQKWFNEYKANILDETTGKVNPDSVKGLYNLGVLYSYTGRSDKATAAWNTIAEYRLSIPATQWANEPRSETERITRNIVAKKRAKADGTRMNPLVFDDEALHWVARAYLRLADQLYHVNRLQPAGYLYARIFAEALDRHEVGLSAEELDQARKRQLAFPPDEQWVGIDIKLK